MSTNQRTRGALELARHLLDVLRQDVAYAARGFRRSPGFTASVIATLALGIGANAALFSLADRLFIHQPEGVANPTAVRRMYLRSNWTEGDTWEIREQFSYAAFDAVKRGLGSRAELAAYTTPDSILLGEGDAAVALRGVYATSGFLPVLGAHTALGRVFSAAEDQMGAGAPVAVISYALWQRAFASDSTIIGRIATIERQKYTIIGVMQQGFAGIDLDPVDVWLPLGAFVPRYGSPSWYLVWRSVSDFRVVARVKAGTSDRWISSAATTPYRLGELEAGNRRPDTSATVLAGPLLETLGPTIHPRTDVAITTRLIGVALIVLLIACANVANLLLARGITRRREIAVRLALGVSRRRLIIQLLIEGGTLALAAGLVAILLGQWGGAALRRAVLPASDWGDSALNWRLVLVTLGVALVTGFLASLAPALRSIRPDLAHTLRSGSRSSGAEHSRLRSSLVVVQAALSVVLLAGAGLFVRSLDHARDIDLGYDTDRILYAAIQFVDATGRTVDSGPAEPAAVLAGMREAGARVQQIPGVEKTALASSAPMIGYGGVGLTLDGGVPGPRVDNLDPRLIDVTPNYFAATGLQLVRGRLINDDDRQGSESVMIVNETGARTYWPGVDPLGKCVFLRAAVPQCSRVVGVVRDSHFDLVEKPTIVLFVAAVQQAGGGYHGHPVLIVRAAPNAIPRVMAETRRVLVATFPQAEPPLIQPLSAHVENQLRPWRLGVSLFAAFGLLSLIVAATGVYSVISYSVSQRTHEIGVRLALGARYRQIVMLILIQGLRVTAVGLALGAALTLALGPLVASMLYDTSPRDPAVLVTTLLGLTVVTIGACALPAWRASHTDPAIALRAD